MKYANDPSWKKMRRILFIGFWIGWVTMLVVAIVIIVQAQKCPSRPDQKWYEKETVYEILPESFKDTSSKAYNGAAKKGDGVGDIKGIKLQLKYLKDIGNRILYINSMYQSNDEEHLALVDHTKIASLFGTMEDFEDLRKEIKKREMRLIMDFIPNHTGKLSKWFLKSQKKEGKYSDYYIWSPCDPNTNSYPNNWMSVKGGRAWTYDDSRKECYYHQLESDKPDLNLWNPDVKQELESILRFWLNKGVDGFHVQNVQYLYEDKNLKDETLTAGKPGKAYSDFEHNHTVNHHKNIKILQSWKAVLDSYNTKRGREKALFVTAGNDLDTTRSFFDAGVSIVRISPLSQNGTSLSERIETQLKDFNFGRIGWMLSNKDTSRLANIASPLHTKAFLTLQETLPGVPFNYYGNEIGMIDHPTLPVPWKYRTPMQWNSKGTGFSKNIKWLSNPDNYTHLNVQTENATGHDYTPLKVYIKLKNLRQKESFQWGTMVVFRDGDLLMYTRKAEGFPGYLVAINLGSKNLTWSFFETTGISKNVKVVFHTHKKDNTAFNPSERSYKLDAGHAVVLEFD
ncbi:amino acid transporter heavy chain SLC3A1-like [Crassostrea virginica]